MDVLAQYVAGTLLENFINLGLGFVVGFCLISRGPPFWIVGVLWAMILVGQNLDPAVDPVRMNEAYVVGVFGVVIGFGASMWRRRRAERGQ